MESHENVILERLLEEFKRKVVHNPNNGVLHRNEEGRAITEADIAASIYAQRRINADRRAYAEIADQTFDALT